MEIENEVEAVVTDTPAPEVNTEVVEETPAAGEGEAATEETPEALAEAAGKQEATGEETPTEEEELAAAAEAAGYKPNFKFKAGVFNKESKSLEQKDFDIDPKFHAIMKDPESEKLVRELHEKAYGLQSVKERFDLVRQESQELAQENRQIRGSIENVKSIYQSAVKSGNWHKLDGFFEKLAIPKEHILQYALAKVQLQEAPEEQRQAMLARIESDRKADELAQQQRELAEQNVTQANQLKEMGLTHTLTRVDVAPLVQEYDNRVGKPGAFAAAVRREGELAWYTEKVDLTPEQAVKRVIDHYGLANGTHGLPAAKPAPGAPAVTAAPDGKKAPVVKTRTTKTIPNLQGRSTSPLAGKAKSVEDLIKYRKEVHGI